MPGRRLRSILFAAALLPGTAAAATIQVPADQPTVQAGIDAASDGDLVLLAPGTYFESISIAGKSVTLASHFQTTGDPSFIASTVLNGTGASHVIEVASSAGAGTAIVGLTLTNGTDGVTGHAPFTFLNNRIFGTTDGIDYENGSGGLVRHSTFESNSDDGLDLDNAVAVVIEDSIIRNNLDDGIEIRLHDYVGPELEIVIRRNVISGNGEDGIQLIDDANPSSRAFVIERNLFVANDMAAIGMMCCQNTVEDYQGASLTESIHILHNTFVGHDHGVTGGDEVVAVNNLFVGTTNIALRRTDGNSIAAHNLFFGNGTDWSESNVDAATTLLADPLLDADHRLSPGSPAIDAGTAFFQDGAEIVLSLGPGQFEGTAPDLGAFETASDAIPTLSVWGLLALAALQAGAVLWVLRRRRPVPRR